MTWYVGNNRPGHPPDYDPVEAPDWDKAVDHTLAEMEAWFALLPVRKGLVEEYHDAVDAVSHPTKVDQPVVHFYEGRIYWIADLP